MSIAFVFPGQGSQAVGMGRDVYEAAAAARRVFDEADAALGFALSALCFDGPEQALTATENAQPALLTVSVALLAAGGLAIGDWRLEAGDARAEAGNRETSPSESPAHPLTRSPAHPLTPAFLAGHSLGEYAALVAAGALDFATALRLVRRRGELMADASEGAMAAIIGMDETALEMLCAEVAAQHGALVIANYNAPGQLVISGATAAVAAALPLAKQRGAKRALPLKVSAAFHSPLMRAAADGLALAVAAASVADARVPVISNVTALPISAAAAIRAELVAQVTAPVRWTASVQALVAAGVDTFVEIGTGSVLTGLIKRIAPAAALVNVSDAAGVAHNLLAT